MGNDMDFFSFDTHEWIEHTSPNPVKCWVVTRAKYLIDQDFDCQRERGISKMPFVCLLISGSGSCENQLYPPPNYSLLMVA